MGQKSNSNFLRLSNNSNSRYIEKNFEEMSYYPFFDLELKKFILRFLKLNGLYLVNCKTSIANSSLKLFISFFISLKSIKIINDRCLMDYKIKQFKGYKKKRKKFFFFFGKKFILKNLPKKRIFSIANYKFKFYKKKWKKKKFLIKNAFFMKLLTVLKNFTLNLFNLKILFQKLNKGNSFRLSNVQATLFRKNILNLRYYCRFNYFKESINVIVIILKKKNTLNLLADFIAFQISILKQHNLFLRFLKQALFLFIFSKLSCLKGLKVIIKGRLNGVPRSSVKGFSLGKLPLNTYSAQMYYAHSVAYTINGTIGIKIWTFENE